MLEVIVLLVLGIIWIVFATWQDLKSREIANWLSFSLVIFALGFRFFYSLFSEQGFQFFSQGVIGFGIFFVLGNLFYYGKMFAGGDTKLMYGIGAIIPMYSDVTSNLNFFLIFIFLLLFSGAVYGLISSFVLGIKNFKAFRKEFKKQLGNKKLMVFISVALGFLIMALGFVEVLFVYLGAIVFLMPWLYVYTKAVDECCMVKNIEVGKLAEGDWLYKDVKIGKKIIKANWEGLDRKDIMEIKKNCKKIMIKQGIPFTPAFLISFLLLMIIYFLKIDLWLWLFG